MANTETTQRYDSIANSIRSALSPVTDADETRVGVAKDLADAKDGSVNAREEVMQALALAAMQGKWTEKEIKLATPLVVTQGNATLPKAIATFVGECKHAMHPLVRVVFAKLVQVRNDAWEAEKADKEAPQVLTKAFQRKYHALIALMGQAAEGNVLDVDGFISFASDRNPDLDPRKVAKVLEGIHAKLDEIARRFPDVDLGAAADMLKKVDHKSLAAARAEMHGDEPDVSTTVVPVTVKAAATESEQEVVEGASDILDEILEAA